MARQPTNPNPKTTTPDRNISTRTNTTNTTMTTTNTSNHERIAKRAYEIFLARGGQHGHHNDDWYQAEREMRLGRQ